MNLNMSLPFVLGVSLFSGLAFANDDAVIVGAITCQEKLSSSTIEKAIKKNIKGKYSAGTSKIYQLKKPININGLKVNEIFFSVEDSDAGLFTTTYAFTNKTVPEITRAVNLGKKFKKVKRNPDDLYHVGYYPKGKWFYAFSIESMKKNHSLSGDGLKTNNPTFFGCSIAQSWE